VLPGNETPGERGTQECRHGVAWLKRKKFRS